MSQLFPVFDVPSSLVSSTNSVIEKYKSAPLFDVDTGEFLVDGGGQLLYGTGYDAWVFWCTKAVCTQRWAHLGYHSFTGVELETAMSEPDRAAQQSALQRTITEALLADPMCRTVRVYDFVFQWLADALSVTFQVLGCNGDTASIQTKVK